MAATKDLFAKSARTDESHEMPWQPQGLILHQLNLCFEYTLFLGGGLILRVLIVF